MLAGIVITAVCRAPLAAYLNSHYFLVGRPQPDTRELLTGSFLNIFIWVIFMVAGILVADRYRLQQYADRVEKEKSKTELDFLNAQFNPHFLFNSINSIYGHIDKQNATARDMLLTFSEMLRYQLYECNTESIAIDKEIGYLRNYVVMQKARKEESLLVELYVGDGVKGFSIAPLLFIAFIENAFKYVGNYEEKENKVIISFERTGDELQFRCCNTRERVYADGIRDKGIGISNARRRMELLYPGRHRLQIADEADRYEVLINLQLS
jgi:LytS/YehU family sensor histidine kinase